ncbi:hypothetical protein D0469_00945 [Peribacillus saganii]|uniref:YqfQ-like protein n=2 Tax=Peribacillus saganii TaxID=2303992 RepID=A0A372LV82_9BACI|nr:hypothetical protein D0469_00945 [Peribacillus saganii]
MFNRVPSQQQPVQPGMFGRVPPQQRPAQQGMFNPQHRGGSFGQQQGRGGLLSKLLGKSKPVPSSPISMFSLPSAPKAETGGLLASLKNPGSISSFLSNTQKVLQAAEAVGPMFQQYGPLVKNFPALWKLYKGLKDSDSVSSEEPESEDNNDTLGTSEYETENFEDDEDLEDYDMEKIKVHEKKPSSSVKNHEKRNSVPRLFF